MSPKRNIEADQNLTTNTHGQTPRVTFTTNTGQRTASAGVQPETQSNPSMPGANVQINLTTRSRLLKRTYLSSNLPTELTPSNTKRQLLSNAHKEFTFLSLMNTREIIIPSPDEVLSKLVFPELISGDECLKIVGLVFSDSSINCTQIAQLLLFLVEGSPEEFLVSYASRDQFMPSPNLTPTLRTWAQDIKALTKTVHCFLYAVRMVFKKMTPPQWSAMTKLLSSQYALSRDEQAMSQDLITKVSRLVTVSDFGVLLSIMLRLQEHDSLKILVNSTVLVHLKNHGQGVLSLMNNVVQVEYNIPIKTFINNFNNMIGFTSETSMINAASGELDSLSKRLPEEDQLAASFLVPLGFQDATISYRKCPNLAGFLIYVSSKVNFSGARGIKLDFFRMEQTFLIAARLFHILAFRHDNGTTISVTLGTYLKDKLGLVYTSDIEGSSGITRSIVSEVDELPPSSYELQRYEEFRLKSVG